MKKSATIKKRVTIKNKLKIEQIEFKHSLKLVWTVNLSIGESANVL
jgi:hypothetical protein